MGVLDRLFNRGRNLLPLPQENLATAKLDEINEVLDSLTQRMCEHWEIVPAEHEAYVILDKPQKHFGIAWIHDVQVSSLKELIEANQLSPSAVEKLLDALGDAYTHTSDVALQRAYRRQKGGGDRTIQ